jgi:hypothetical protein
VSIRVEVAGQGTFVVPARDVAIDRANYMAVQATGSGRAPGNDEYDEVVEQETQFALGRPDILLDWARHHMRRAELERYRVDATQD